VARSGQSSGPYIQRDGLTNPDNFVAHRQLLLGFARDFGALAAAYRLSGEERFAVAPSGSRMPGLSNRLRE